MNDNTRGRFETNRHEKLNDESPIRDCRLEDEETHKPTSEELLPTGMGVLSCLLPEMEHASVFRNYAKPGGSDVRQKHGPTKPLAT